MPAPSGAWSSRFHPLPTGSISRRSSHAQASEASEDDSERGSSKGAGRASPIGIPASYNLGRRTSVSAESLDPSAYYSSAQYTKPERVDKDAVQVARIERAIRDNLLFRNLDEDQHRDVLAAMQEVRVPKGTDVIVQGAVGDFFYVVEEGTFDVWVSPNPSPSPVAPAAPAAADPYRPLEGDHPSSASATGSSKAHGQRVAAIEPGGSFGELALMYNSPRAATVVATTDAVLWALDRVTFRSILMVHTSRRRRMYEDFLAEVPILRSLEAHERAKIADALEPRVFEPGADVVREGELGKNFYIIESGEANVLQKDSDSTEQHINSLKKGDYFGGKLEEREAALLYFSSSANTTTIELALLNNSPRLATVRAASRLRVATLGEKAFTRLLGPVKDILKRNAGSYESASDMRVDPAPRNAAAAAAAA
jgi:cAMP-dependent protein kinase regulator